VFTVSQYFDAPEQHHLVDLATIARPREFVRTARGV
jgi:hypothetical protein